MFYEGGIPCFFLMALIRHMQNCPKKLKTRFHIGKFYHYLYLLSLSFYNNIVSHLFTRSFRSLEKLKEHLLRQSDDKVGGDTKKTKL